jgi:AraC-like DNA-binding protein
MKRRDILLLEEIKSYVDSHLDKSLTINALCKDFGINRYKLQKGFQHITGKPIRVYIIHRKMELAARRLQETEDSIKALSFEFGYRSSGNFCKAFKLVFDVSPTEYRNQACPVS